MSDPAGWNTRFGDYDVIVYGDLDIIDDAELALQIRPRRD